MHLMHLNYCQIPYIPVIYGNLSIYHYHLIYSYCTAAVMLKRPLQLQFGVNKLTKALKLHFMREPPRRGQPPYKGQMARPRFVLSSEVLLYAYVQVLLFRNKLPLCVEKPHTN